VLPFTGLSNPLGVAVDTAGNVYVTDNSNNRVLKLQAGSSTQDVLPFTGLKNPSGWRWIPPATCTSPTTATTAC
jgi:serine/threonine-protein kinase